MRKRLRLIAEFFKIQLKGAIQYPLPYWLGFTGQIISYGSTFAVIYIAVSSFGELAGWKAEEVLLLYAFELISYAISAFFFFHPSTRLAARIRSGDFDASLTKPMNPFAFQVCNYGMALGYLSHFSLALGVMIFALIRIRFNPTPLNLMILVLFILGSSAVQGGLLVLCSVFSFKLLNSNPFINLFWMFKGFLKYPISIYGGVLQVILTVVIPFGFINFYPAQYLLSREGGFFSVRLGIITPLVGTAMLALAYFLWMGQLKRYNSSGS